MKNSIISDQICNDFNHAFKIIKEHNFQYVEIHNAFNKSIEAISIEEAYTLKSLLDKYNLKVSNLASTIFFMCPLKDNYRLSLFNEEFYTINGDVDKHLAYLENACKVADILQCENIRIFPFRFPDNENIIQVGTDEDLELIIKNLKKAVVIAEKYHKTLVLENCPYSHCPKGLMTLKIIKAINSFNLKLLWDPANSYRAEKHKVPSKYLNLTIYEEYEQIKDYIGHIHLKNYHYDPKEIKPFVHKALLDGDIDYYQLFNLLDYDKVLSLEPEVNEVDTIKCLEQLKRINP